jgi:hypothetical protein
MGEFVVPENGLVLRCGMTHERGYFLCIGELRKRPGLEEVDPDVPNVPTV